MEFLIMAAQAAAAREEIVARIVCQVLQRPDRVTFVWSQEDASFEPYHLSAAETAQFHEAASRARQHLARILAGGDAKEPLAQAGHDMYDLIFLSSATSARKVEQWLKDKNAAVDSLEIVSDAPGKIPWNAVYEDNPSKPPNLAAFWGMRYAITAGRRVNPLRLNPVLPVPDVLQVLDPALPAEQLPIWQQSSGAGNWRLASSRTELNTAVRHRCPDLLCWVGRFSGSKLMLGNEPVSLKELRNVIDEAEEGSTEPLLLLHPFVAEGEGDQNGWQEFRTQAALMFPGLITWDVPPTAKLPGSLENSGLTGPAAGGCAAGAGLARTASAGRLAGARPTAFCPAETSLGELGHKTEPLTKTSCSLPEQPYRPLAVLDAEDRPLLGGRDQDIFRCASMLDESNAGLLLLHGSASVGKTSFLRAGLIPYLENDAVGFLALRDRTEPEGAVPNERECPVVAVRASRDLAGQLAEALCVFCDQPYRYTTPAQESITVPLRDLLRQAIQGDGDVSDTAIQKKSSAAIQQKQQQTGGGSIPADGIQQGTGNLGPLTGPAPQSAGEGTVQPSDLWEALRERSGSSGPAAGFADAQSASRSADPDRTGRRDFHPGQERGGRRTPRPGPENARPAPPASARCKIILSLRSEYLGQLRSELAARCRTGRACPCVASAISRKCRASNCSKRCCCRPPPNRSCLPRRCRSASTSSPSTSNLRRPWWTKSVPRPRRPAKVRWPCCRSSLSGCTNGPRNATSPRVDKIDLKIVGGVDDALGKMVEVRMKKLPVGRSVRKPLRLLLEGFYTNHADGTVTRDTFSLEEMEQAWRGRKPDAEKAFLAAEEAGLLELQQLTIAGKESTYASLPQDSLARVAQDWAELKKSQKLARSKVIDAWFLALPLVVLAAVLAWKFSARNWTPILEKLHKDNEILAEQVRGVQLPKYLGDLARTEQAWHEGAIDRMRKILLTHQAPSKWIDDLRGFEWYHLWHLANSEKLALKGHKSTVKAVAVSAQRQGVRHDVHLRRRGTQ